MAPAITPPLPDLPGTMPATIQVSVRGSSATTDHQGGRSPHCPSTALDPARDDQATTFLTRQQTPSDQLRKRRRIIIFAITGLPRLSTVVFTVVDGRDKPGRRLVRSNSAP
jgi:hypothetical protein